MLRGTKGIGGKRCRGEAYAKSVADNSIGLIQFPCGEGGEGRAVNICRPSFGTHSLAPRTDSFSSDRYEIPQVFDNPGRMRPKETFPSVFQPFPARHLFREFRSRCNYDFVTSGGTMSMSPIPSTSRETCQRIYNYRLENISFRYKKDRINSKNEDRGNGLEKRFDSGRI